MPPWRTPAGGPEAAKLCAVRTRPRTVAALLLSLLTAPVVLTGCGGGDTDGQSPSASSVGDRRRGDAPRPSRGGDTAEDGATDAPAFPANAEPDTADAVRGRVGDGERHPRRPAGRLRPGRVRGRRDRDARAGTSGTSTPRRPRAAATPVDVAGDAVLQVTLTGAGYPYDTGVEEFSSSGPLSAADTEVVTEVVCDATFEGHVGRVRRHDPRRRRSGCTCWRTRPASWSRWPTRPDPAVSRARR